MYDRPLAVIMLHINIKTNPNPIPNRSTYYTNLSSIKQSKAKQSKDV